MSEYSGYSTGYISMVSAGGGLRPLADQFLAGSAATTNASAASTTAVTANTTNALESTTGVVANVWA